MKQEGSVEKILAQSITYKDLFNNKEDQRQQKWKQQLKSIFTNINLYKGNLLPSDLFIIDPKYLHIKEKLKKLNEESGQTGIYYPTVHSLDEAKPFLKTKGCFFIIYADVQNAEKLIQQFEKNGDNENILENISEIHIYNLSSNSCFPKFCDLRNRCRKVKALHNSLDAKIDNIMQSLKYRAKFSKVNDVIEYKKGSYKSYWPGFLTADDLSFNASYRANILANVRMVRQNEGEFYQVSSKQIKESKIAFEQFFQKLKKSVDSQHRKSQEWQTFQKLYNDYMLIERNCQGYLKYPCNVQNKIKIMSFYKAKSQYYNVLNTMLKICKTPSEFKNVALPAAQTFVIIKDFYDSMVTNQDETLIRPQYQLYRGTRSGNMKNFKVGQIYETLGNLSCSTSRNVAVKSFVKIQEPESCLVILHIPERKIRNRNQLKYDNGFLDFDLIFRNDEFKTIFQKMMKKLNSPTFEDEKQVLINLGAILKFIKYEESNVIPEYHFQYMTVQELQEWYQQQKNSIKNVNPNQSFQRLQKMVLSYRYYKLQYNEIEDQGDLLRQAQQFDAEKDYYVQRSKSDTSANIKLKLIDSQLRCGESLVQIQKFIKTFIQENIETIFLDNTIKKRVKTILKDLDKRTEYEDFLQQEISILKKDQKNYSFDIASALNEEAEIYLLEKERLSHCKAVLNESLKILTKNIQKLNKQLIELQQNNSGQPQDRNCCFNFAVNLGLMNPKVRLSQEQRKQKEQNIREQLLRNTELTLKVEQNLIDCYSRMDEALRKKDSQNLQSLYKSCDDRLNSYTDMIGGKQKFSNQLSLLRLKLDILLLNGSKSLAASPKIKQFQQEIQKQIEKEKQIDPNSEKVSSLIYTLASSKKQESSSVLKNPQSVQYTTTTIDETQIQISLKQAKTILNTKNQKYLDEQKLENLVNEITIGMKKSIEISIIHKGPDHPSILSKRLTLSEHLLLNNKIEQSNDQALQVTKSSMAESHISGAKAYFLLGKNYECKGELGRALVQLEKAKNLAEKMLRTDQKKNDNRFSIWDYVVGRRENPLKNLYSCSLYYDIEIQIARINRQMVQKISPKKLFEDLMELKQILLQYIDQSLRNRFMSKICQEMAYILSLSTEGNIEDLSFSVFLPNQNFLDYFKESIEYIQQRGQNDMDVANIYCSIAKQLTKVDSNYICNSQQLYWAEYYLDEALKIFSIYPVNHPSNWVAAMTICKLSMEKKKFKQKSNQLIKRNSSQFIKQSGEPSSKIQITNSAIKIHPEPESQIFEVKESFEQLDQKQQSSIKLCVDLVNKRYKLKDHINYIKVMYFYSRHLESKDDPKAKDISEFLIKILDKDPILKQITCSLIQQETETPELQKIKLLSALDERVQIKQQICSRKSKKEPLENQTTRPLIHKQSNIQINLPSQLRSSFSTTKQTHFGTQRTNQSKSNFKKTTGIKLVPVKYKSNSITQFPNQQNNSIGEFLN